MSIISGMIESGCQKVRDGFHGLQERAQKAGSTVQEKACSFWKNWGREITLLSATAVGSALAGPAVVVGSLALGILTGAAAVALATLCVTNPVAGSIVIATGVVVLAASPFIVHLAAQAIYGE